MARCEAIGKPGAGCGTAMIDATNMDPVDLFVADILARTHCPRCALELSAAATGRLAAMAAFPAWPAAVLNEAAMRIGSEAAVGVAALCRAERLACGGEG
jgi:hypothetical protein